MGRLFLKRKEDRDDGGYVENVNSIKNNKSEFIQNRHVAQLIENKVDATLVVF